MTSPDTGRAGEVRVIVSWPPSVNNLFLNVAGRGRVPTKEYTAWRKTAAWELQAQRPRKFTGPVEITVELCPPTRRAFDPDGKLKGPIDLLVTHQIIPDDSIKYVRSVTAKIVESGAPCTIMVRAI
jgi:Holliday junction resolvase RusA-like endonuclease